MQPATNTVLLNLFLLAFPGPAASDSTILPPPTIRVLYDSSLVNPPILSRDAILPRTEFKDRDGRRMRLPRLHVVNDNSKRPATHNNIVVIVAGNPTERERWSQSARRHFGQTAFIFNDLFCIHDVAKVLGTLPEGSVAMLVFGGHGEFSDGGIFMGIKEEVPSHRLFSAPRILVVGEHINPTNLLSAENKEHRTTVVRSLSKEAYVEFHACRVGDERNVANLAFAFQRRTWANPGDVGEWGVGQYPWFFKDPPRRK